MMNFSFFVSLNRVSSFISTWVMDRLLDYSIANREQWLEDESKKSRRRKRKGLLLFLFRPDPSYIEGILSDRLERNAELSDKEGKSDLEIAIRVLIWQVQFFLTVCVLSLEHRRYLKSKRLEEKKTALERINNNRRS